MKMKMTILTVNQDDGHSDRITSIQENMIWKHNEFEMLKICIDNKRRLTIENKDSLNRRTLINFNDIDIDGLIEYLHDVKEFLYEEDIVKTIKG